MKQAEPAALVEPLSVGWEVASAEPLTVSPDALERLDFIPAQVPGTVASAWRAAGLWQPGLGIRFDDREHWFRCRFDARPAEPGERVAIKFSGVTACDIWLNGKSIGGGSMFEEFEADVTAVLNPTNELIIACRALNTKAYRRALPLARWRTRVVADQQLRWLRTTLLGRAPGFAPEPEPVGPWRPVSLVRRRAVVEAWRRSVSLQGADGVVEVSFQVGNKLPVGGQLQVGEHSATLVCAGQQASATCRVASATLWWPHTHGEPALYPVQAIIELDDGTSIVYEDTPVGFRSIGSGVKDPVEDGLALRVNDTPVFCRGVVWTPIEPVSLQSEPGALRQRLVLLREAGINMIRVVGTAWYEDEAFHRLCDELGLLVWQDMMFANMDYPFGDEGFAERVRVEAETQCERLARHPSTTVLCGNSEIEQQAAMLGLAPSEGRASFFGEQLPAIAARHLPGLPYLPSAPCGGSLPFRTNRGVANYFGVGAYLRPLEDARLAEVRFASECLAFSNVPEPEAIDEMAAATPGGISPTHPVWKRGVPRDAGVGWDFEDVRDHYLRLLYGVDPVALRYASIERYFELSRLVSGELMAHVFGEWRRPASPCGGGIVLWCNDLTPGAGWGIIDSAGRPKAPYWFLKRMLAPVAVWMTGEGLNGVDVHVANDAAQPLEATLRIALYQHGERLVGQGSLLIHLAAHGRATYNIEAILGHFADAAYSYRFGPPGHDLICARLYASDGAMSSQAFHFPAGRPFLTGGAAQGPIERLGITGRCVPNADGTLQLSIVAARLAWGVRVAARGCMPSDQYFGLEPGVGRTVVLQTGAKQPSSVAVTAVNAEGRIVFPVEPAA